MLAPSGTRSVPLQRLDFSIPLIYNQGGYGGNCEKGESFNATGIGCMKWKLDPFLLAVVVIGIAIFVFKCVIVYPIKWIGETDAAAYVEMADNFIHGKGLSNDYIQYSYFFSPLRYPEITHPDAHYAPL